MKHIQPFISAAICGVVLMLASGVCAESTKPGVITVVRLAGESRYSLGDGVWHPLVVGKILAPGAVIQTGHDATVDIVLGKKILVPQASPLPDRVNLATDEKVRDYVSYKPAAEQNTVRMMGDTVLAIDKLMISDSGVDTVSDTELDLRQGAIYNSVKKLSGASQYLIKIPNGIAGVRGTLFYISATGECAAYQNSVVLSIIGPDGKPETVVVEEGTRFNPNTDQTSSWPPGISALPSSLNDEMDQVFAALRTLYYGEINLTLDYTETYVSPISGNPHHHRPGHGGWFWWW